MKNKIIGAVCTLSLASLALAGCSSNHQDDVGATIDNAPTASATTAQSSSPESSTQSTPSSSSSTASVVDESSPSSSSSSEKGLLDQKQDDVLGMVATASNSTLGQSSYDTFVSDLETVHIKADDSVKDYLNPVSSDSIVRVIKQASNINSSKQGDTMTFAVQVYKGQSAIFANESVAEAQMRTANAMTNKVQKDPNALVKKTLTFTVNMDSDHNSGTLSMKES